MLESSSSTKSRKLRNSTSTRATSGTPDRDVLAQIATCVTTGPLAGRSLTLVGRADPRGTVGYNMALGARRAHSAGAYLEQLGVGSSRVMETSRGELDATGTDERTWQIDRRVDVMLR